jgi:hypothetical protein
LRINTSQDSRFSKQTIGLQLQVNSSSLGPFKTCPRKYYYEVIQGLETPERSVHLTFGTLMHQGIALYEKWKLNEVDHEQALLFTIEWALKATWNKQLNRPWSSGHPNKNRASLIRSLVWYLDHWNEVESYKPIKLKNGEAAIELSFEINTGLEHEGEQISFIGKLDRLVKLNDSKYVFDTKTTEWAIDTNFFKKYSPDNQFSLYTLAGKVAFNEPLKGLIADAIQIGAQFTRMNRGLIERSDETLDEWLIDARWHLRSMIDCAKHEYWPQNDRNCGHFGGCQFREICSMSPIAREVWLDKGFRVKRIGVEGDLL